jgi:hypothetical protein
VGLGTTPVVRLEGALAHWGLQTNTDRSRGRDAKNAPRGGLVLREGPLSNVRHDAALVGISTCLRYVAGSPRVKPPGQRPYQATRPLAGPIHYLAGAIPTRPRRVIGKPVSAGEQLSA